MPNNLNNENSHDNQPGPSRKLDNPSTSTQQYNTTNCDKMPKWFKPL